MTPPSTEARPGTHPTVLAIAALAAICGLLAGMVGTAATFALLNVAAGPSHSTVKTGPGRRTPPMPLPDRDPANPSTPRFDRDRPNITPSPRGPSPTTPALPSR